MNQSMKTPVHLLSLAGLRHLCRPVLMMSRLQFRAHSVGLGWCADAVETWWNHRLNKRPDSNLEFTVNSSWALLLLLSYSFSASPQRRRQALLSCSSHELLKPWIIQRRMPCVTPLWFLQKAIVPAAPRHDGGRYLVSGSGSEYTACDDENAIWDSAERSCGWFGFELNDKHWTVVFTEKVHLLSPGPRVWEEEWVSFWDRVQTCA